MQSPMMAALLGARTQGMAEGDHEMTMPMGEDKQTGTLMLDRSLCGDHSYKKGDEILVRGKITAIGNKLGFAPSGIEPAEAEAEEEEEYDPDMDDSL